MEVSALRHQSLLVSTFGQPGRQAGTQDEYFFVEVENSTAVGMLFDHGCDAISSMLVGLQFVRLIQADSLETTFYALVFLIMIPNFLIIWTQYCIGAFHFDVINPIDEGLPCYQLMGILGYFLDYSFWRKQHIITSYNYEFLLGFWIMAMVLLGKTTKNVLKDTKRSRADLLATLGLPLVLIGLVAAVKLSGLGAYVYGEHFYAFFYTVALYWGRNEIYMQVCSVANQKFNAFNWSTLFFIGILILPIALPTIRSHLSTHLYICLAIQALFLGETIFSFLNQAASILNIKLFHVNPPPKTA